MKIPFVGSSATARSVNANAQRSLNVYLEMDQGNPRAPVAMYGRPGLTLRATLGTAASRGIIASGAYWYVVAGSHVYRIDSAYAVTDCGAIGTSTGRVGMATNGTEVLIVDGAKGWLVTGTTLAEITDVDFPDGVTQAACIDSFFIVAGDGTQKIYWNETPNTGTDWNGLDFASAEGSPDATIGIVAVGRELWPFGSKSAEVWVNTGSDPLFQRSGSAFITQGTAAPFTLASMDSTAFWLGSSETGQAMVFKAQSYSPVRISTHALETAISRYTTISDAYAWCFQIEGHSFYVLTFPTANATWAYDAATGEWFEWGWRNPLDNTDNRHRAACCAFANGKHLVGDWETGRLYTLESDSNTDNTDPIRRLRRTQTQRSERRLFYGQGTIDMETAVATDATPEPLVMLRYSDDDGHSWSNEKQLSLGRVGQYGKRVRIPPTGSTRPGRGRVWELSMTDDARFALFGADVDVVEGS